MVDWNVRNWCNKVPKTVIISVIREILGIEMNI